MRVLRTMMVTILLLAIANGCTSTGKGAGGREILVGAATSTAAVLPALVDMFERANPGVTVRTHFAASGTILHQLEQGTAIDVVLFADGVSVTQARQRNIAIASVRPVASNRLIVAAPASSSRKAISLEALLSQDEIKFCIGNPAYVPLGRYSIQALAASGVAKEISDNFILAGSASQVAQYLALGEVDGAIIYGSDFKRLEDNVVAVMELPLAKPPEYFAGVVAGGAQTELSEKFVRFLGSNKAKAIFEQNGFRPF